MANPVPFRHEISTPTSGVVEVTVSGTLTADETDHYLAALGSVIDQSARTQKVLRLLFIDRLSGFESARVPKAHGIFFASRATTVDRVAVVTEKISVTFGLSVVKLLAPPKQKIQAFKSRDDALRWLRG